LIGASGSSRRLSKTQGFIRVFDRRLGQLEAPIKNTRFIRFFDRRLGQLVAPIKNTRFYKGF
jgi:hypothetical protein